MINPKTAPFYNAYLHAANPLSQSLGIELVPTFVETPNKAFASKGKLTMPILALGAEKLFGEQQAAIMREVGTNVEGGIIANSGHWVMEEQPDATVKAVREFLDKK